MTMVLTPVLAGCGGRRHSVAVTPPYRLAGASCLRAASARSFAYTPWAVTRSGQCGVATPLVSPGSTTVAFTPPLRTSCALLVAIGDYERRLQGIAAATLGSRIIAIRHYGSHACRAMTGNAARMSLHAHARAVDIAGFVTADGRVISVARDWDAWGSSGRFLRQAARAACSIFSVVLTPDSNGDHANHLHLDLGSWRRCDA